MKLYMIDKEDYIRHINDKVQLYALLKFLTNEVGKLPANRGNKNLSTVATQFSEVSDLMYESWNIPLEYLRFRDEEDLTDLMENELLDPDEFAFPDEESHEQECGNAICGGCYGECLCANCNDCGDRKAEDEIIDIAAITEVVNAVITIVNYFQQH